jgi:nucleoside 2-deoxyribosyltransferase
MFQVYLAGPIAGLNFNAASGWREDVQSRLDWTGEIKALSPLRQQDALRNIQTFTKLAGETERLADALALPKGFTSRDRRDAQVCDVLFVNLLGATQVSIGTVLEIAWADAVRTPIVLVMEDHGNPHDHAMINEISAFRVTTVDDAIRVTCAILGVEI